MNLPPSKLPYVVCAMIMSLIGVVAVLLILLMRPDKDNTQIFATIASMLVPTTAAILALIKVGEVHEKLNGRLDQLVAAEKRASKAAGVVEGQSLVPPPVAVPAPIVLPIQVQPLIAETAPAKEAHEEVSKTAS